MIYQNNLFLFIEKQNFQKMNINKIDFRTSAFDMKPLLNGLEENDCVQLLYRRQRIDFREFARQYDQSHYQRSLFF